MGKTLKILIFILLISMISGVILFSVKSDIWQQDIVLENALNWEKLNTGWIVVDDKGANDYSSITIRRTFYANEVYEILNKQMLKSSKNLPEEEPNLADTPVLFFITHNQKIRAYVDFDSGSEEQQLYSFGNNGKQFIGNESGTSIHFVPVPFAGKGNITVTIRLSPSFIAKNLQINKLLYATKKAKVPTFYFGWRSVCLNSYLKSFILQAIPIIIILALGFLALFIYVVGRLFGRGSFKHYLYWGYFAVFCGIGFFSESKIGYYFAINSFALYFFSTVIISIYPLLFLKYMKERTTMSNNDLVARIFMIISPINIFLVSLVAVLPEFPFSLIRAYVIFVLGLFVIFMMIVVIREAIISNGVFTAFDIAILISGTFILTDFIFYFVNKDLTDFFFFSRLGMLIFFLVCGILITDEKINDKFLNEKSMAMEQLAYKDILTGCRNTAALWRDNKKHELFKTNFSMVLFYIKNINEINKMGGYSEGDLAVKTIAQILQQVFLEENVYRLSGTKFCIVLKEENINQYEKNRIKVQELLDFYNEKNMKRKIEIDGTEINLDSENDMDFDMLYFKLLKKIEIKS